MLVVRIHFLLIYAHPPPPLHYAAAYGIRMNVTAQTTESAAALRLQYALSGADVIASSPSAASAGNHHLKLSKVRYVNRVSVPQLLVTKCTHMYTRYNLFGSVPFYEHTRVLAIHAKSYLLYQSLTEVFIP